MDTKEWIEIFHQIGIIIGAIAAVIAAASSLKNGRTLKNGSSKDGTPKPPPKKTKNVASKDDWYRAPETW